MIRILCCLLLGGLASLQAEPETVTAITYNIRLDTRGDVDERDWPQRRDTVTTYLRESGATIIGMQEVVHNQLEDVETALEPFDHTGVGRTDGKNEGEYSPIFYDPAVWEIDPAEQGTFWLSDTPETPGSFTWGNEIPRICSWARLKHRGNGASIYVYNTHWDHRSQPSRERAAKLMVERIRARKHADEPVLLMGDFNAKPDNAAIQTLLASGLFAESPKIEYLTFNSWEGPLVAGAPIDHIFLSPEWQAAKMAVEANGDPPGSDHHPVAVEARLRGESP